MLKALWIYIKEHPIVYLLIFILALVSSVLYVWPNMMIQGFVDAIVTNQLTSEKLSYYVFVYLGSAVILYLVDVTWVILLFGQSYRFQAEERRKLFKRLLELRTPFYEQYRSGDLMTRMTNDIDYFGTTIGYGLMIIVSNIIITISLLTIMFGVISWRLTGASILPLIILGVLVYYLGNQYDKHFDANRDAVSKLSHEVLEVVDGVRVMRAYGKSQLEQDRFGKRTQAVLQESNKLNFVASSFGNVAKLLTGCSVAISLGYGGYLVSQGDLTIGQVVSFQIYIGLLGNVIWGLSDLVAVYKAGKLSFGKIQEILHADDLVNRSGNLPIQSLRSLEFQEVSFAYPTSQVRTIKHLSFILEAGQTLGIVGRTGAGKTTIVRQLLRQYPTAQAGKILINGQPIEVFAVKDIAHLIGYVPQEHILFSKSVKQNIEFGKSNPTDLELGQAIKNADFDKDIDRMVNGLETLIGEKGVAISGGQKQRVSMARALIREPELLILDDSLSAVDAKTERAIIRNIQAVRQGKMTIIITHRLSAVAHADNILVIEKGEIVESGKPAQLLESNGWYAQQHKQQTMEEGQDENI